VLQRFRHNHAALDRRHRRHYRDANRPSGRSTVSTRLRADQWRPADRTQILPTLAYQYGLQRSELGQGAAVMVSVLPSSSAFIVLLTRRMLREKVCADGDG